MTGVFEYELNQYLDENKRFFDAAQLSNIKKAIVASDKTMREIRTLKFKSPTVAVALSVCLGYLGADRFYNGNYIMGVIKLSTCGLCLLWWVFDMVAIGGSVKRKNLETLLSFLTGESVSHSVKLDGDTLKKIVTNKEIQQAAKELGKAHREFTDSMSAH
jgi:TM2 domain-containing membrane protein YozV